MVIGSFRGGFGVGWVVPAGVDEDITAKGDECDDVAWKTKSGNFTETRESVALQGISTVSFN